MSDKKLSKGKKIMIISALNIWSLGENTGAQSLWKTLEGYAKSGWDVIFITSNNKTQKDFTPYNNLKVVRFDSPIIKKIFDIKFIGFLVRNLWWIYFQITAYLIGNKIAKRINIDLFYGYEVYGVIAAKLLSSKFKKPLVTRFQGSSLSRYLDDKGFIWKMKNWWHVAALKTNSDLIIMTNDGTRGDTVLKILGANMKKVRFWINGVNKNLLSNGREEGKLRSELNIAADEKILLSVSRLERWKRVDRTLRALPGVLKRFSKTKFLIIGEGGERGSLENLAKELGISDAVVFVGGIPHNELGGYYNLADIFVSMYDISNVGNPLFEAMISEKCILAYDIGDTNKFIYHEKNGVLIKKPTPEKISAALIELLSNEDKRIKLGTDAKKFADNNLWSWDDRIKAEIKEVGKILK